MAGGKHNRTRSSTKPQHNSQSFATSSSFSPSKAATAVGATLDELGGYTKEQLKAECRRRGQKTSGTKTELLQRLSHKMQTSTTNSILRKEKHITANGRKTPPPQQDNATRLAREKERRERESILLWRRPVVTLDYFFRELYMWLNTYGRKLVEYRRSVFAFMLVVCGLLAITSVPGPHQEFVQKTYKQIAWCLYWCGLGFLSSVGLGTGLHTFILYLGPHIAAVTIASYECNALNFPEPPYPDEIICPTNPDKSLAVSILSIMAKVRVEAMCWGAGTALGELPPYFMARASRLSGYDPDEEDEDLQELEELQRKERNREKMTFAEKVKLFVETLVEKVGFFGILACASIPNPLFDLAGITCGHFLVPFWKFFGATLIGKAIIKMHIQKLFVIIAFNEALIEQAVAKMDLIPIVGTRFQQPFKEFLEKQKTKLHQKVPGPKSSNMLASVFEKFVIAMILYFVVSIINSFAQSYHKRMHRARRQSYKVATD